MSEKTSKYSPLQIIVTVIFCIVFAAIVGPCLFNNSSNKSSPPTTGWIEIYNYTGFGFEIFIDGTSVGFLKSGDSYQPYEDLPAGKTLHVVCVNPSLLFYKEYDLTVKAGVINKLIVR